MNLNLGDTHLIIDECANEGLLRKQAAYVLATAYWETGRTMKPVREAHGGTDQQSINRLENAWRKGQLKWVKTPYWRDGFFGRGYVQLTHKYNYEKAGRKLGVNMVRDPSIALQSDIAARVLVVGSKEGWFTGKKLSDYITAERTDWRNARRIINGTDKASTIAKLAGGFDAALVTDGYRPGRKSPPKSNPLSGISQLIQSILSLIVRLFK